MTETCFIHSNADGSVKFPETTKSSCKMVLLHLFQTRQFPLKDSFYNKATRLPGLCLQAPLTSPSVCSGSCFLDPKIYIYVSHGQQAYA